MKYRSILDYKRTILNIKKSENIFYNIDPFCTPLSWYSGNAYFMLDNQNEALQDYKRAFEINPNHIHVLNNYGTSLNIIGNSKESIVLFEKALKIAPNFEDALLNLVAIYYNENQVDKAYDLFNKYNEISSNNRFYEILNFVFKDKISIFANSCKNDYLKKQLFDISNNPDWIKSIYIKSRKNIFSFKKQLFLDAIYMLENYNKDITKDEIKIIKQNFNTP